MTKRPTHLLIAVLAVTLGAAFATAQQGRVQLNLKGLEKNASEHSEIALDGDMLRMALSNSKSANPEAQQVLAHLQGVYIQDFEFKQEHQYPASVVKDIEKQLSGSAWHTIVKDVSQHEQSWIAVQRNREMITAIAIFDAEPRELSLVNIVGPLPHGLASLSALSSLGGAMGKMGKLGKLGKIDGSAPAAPKNLHPPAPPAPAGH
jgi:hypothetical protein